MYLVSDGCSNSRKALYLSPQSSECEKRNLHKVMNLYRKFYIGIIALTFYIKF